MNSLKTSIVYRAKIALYYEQGQLFEKYIQELFDHEYFKLKRWRKSKLIPKDTFILDESYPDLELIFTGKKNYRFAIECKWRKAFYKGKISWATEEQIGIYEHFQNKFAMPVFVAIGIGGVPSGPEHLFVTPLCNISGYPDVYKHQLIPFKRQPTRRFEYDTIQLKLW